MSEVHHDPALLGAARRAFPSFEEAVVAGWHLRSDPELPNRRANCAWAVGEPAVPLIEAIDEVVAWLSRDARTSNRQIAAALGVTEGTVRARIKRMEEAGFIRGRVTILDNFALGLNFEVIC